LERGLTPSWVGLG